MSEKNAECFADMISGSREWNDVIERAIAEEHLAQIKYLNAKIIELGAGTLSDDEIIQQLRQLAREVLERKEARARWVPEYRAAVMRGDQPFPVFRWRYGEGNQ